MSCCCNTDLNVDRIDGDHIDGDHIDGDDGDDDDENSFLTADDTWTSLMYKTECLFPRSIVYFLVLLLHLFYWCSHFLNLGPYFTSHLKKVIMEML